MPHEPLRFTTLRVGYVAIIVDDDDRLEYDVRVLRCSDGSYRLLSGVLSEPLSTLEEAMAAAEPAPSPSPNARIELRWCDPNTLEPDEIACSICGAAVHVTPRYPRRLCPACVLEATDAQGRPLVFANTGLGGFEARYADDRTIYPSHTCWVRGTRCHADEGRFGGIVVQPVE